MTWTPDPGSVENELPAVMSEDDVGQEAGGQQGAVDPSRAGERQGVEVRNEGPQEDRGDGTPEEEERADELDREDRGQITLVPDLPVQKPGEGGHRGDDCAEERGDEGPHLELSCPGREIQHERQERNGEKGLGEMDEYRVVIDVLQDLHPFPRSFFAGPPALPVSPCPVHTLRCAFAPVAST